MAVAFSPIRLSPTQAEPPRKRLDDRHLSFGNLVSGFSEREPACSIRLRKALSPAGSRRPFHFKAVAAEAGEVEVAFDGKGDHDLAARLPKAAQLHEIARRNTARLFRELPAGRGERLLV